LQKRKETNFIYQVPPSFHLFEESWMLSITNKQEKEEFTEEKILFLNKYLTRETQLEYIEYGGLPVHRDLLTSLDVWRKYPFIPPLWEIYFTHSPEIKLNKRDSFTGIYKIGRSIAQILDLASKDENLKLTLESENEDIKILRKIFSDNLNNGN